MHQSQAAKETSHQLVTDYPAKPPPPLNVPESQHTVSVSIIDTTTKVTVPSKLVISPAILGHDRLVCPAYSFLIEHPSGRRLLFDLGIKKEWEEQAPRVVNRIKENGFIVETKKHVADILEEHGVNRDSIEAIIWSHWHWDHTGDPSTFSKNADLIVGPGFKANFLPGYPTNKDSPIRESYYEGRNLREIDFSNQNLNLGRFEAFDYFGDGSFYLLNSPGHAIGHICGLARTTPDTFIFMGGDIVHHGGEFRPTEYLPIPAQLLPNPLDPRSIIPCPGALFEAIHPKQSSTEPFYGIAPGGVSADPEETLHSISKLEEFDPPSQNVFVIFAHDECMLEILDFFSKNINDWKQRDWQTRCRWAFLKDFQSAVEAKTK